MPDDTSERVERAERWRAWMAAAQRGDADAYQRLLTDLLPFVRRLVQSRLQGPAANRDAAEDIVQDVFVSIHTARHTFRPERPLEPWVRAIARNAVVDWGRRQTRLRSRRSDVEADALPAPESEPPAEERALSPAVERALAALPEGQRQAVRLLKLEGLSVAEAARRVGVSPGALKLRAHRGYRALRETLGRERL